jgi:hypothetical protein
MKSMRELIALVEVSMLNELSKDTLKSYSKKRGEDIGKDVDDAKSAKDLSHKKGDKWDDEAD